MLISEENFGVARSVVVLRTEWAGGTLLAILLLENSEEFGE
jgi:hypothetical protein